MSDATRAVRDDLTAGGFLWVLAAAGAFAGLYVIGLWVAVEYFGVGLSSLGLFGDSFGALTSFFNALAFAAVVITVVLQVRELRESREQLVEQAKAQKAWAEAASEQIRLTKELEFAKSRPFIQSEWERSAHDHHRFAFSIRNVGPGVAVIHAIEIRVSDRCIALFNSNEQFDANADWTEAIRRAIGESGFAQTLTAFAHAFDDFSRVLGPGEKKTLVTTTMGGSIDEVNLAYQGVCAGLEIIVYFKSVNGESLSTRTQFHYLRLGEQPALPEPPPASSVPFVVAD